MSFSGSVRSKGTLTKPLHLLAPLAALLLSNPTSIAAPGGQHSVPHAEFPVDALGRPVLDDDGRRIVYGRFETEQARRDAEDRASTPSIRPEPTREVRQVKVPPSETLGQKLTSPTAIDLEWHFTVFATRIAEGGLQVADLDGDGNPEIVANAVAAFGDFWYVVQESGGEYAQSWSSLPSDDSIHSLATADLDGDGDDEVVLGEGSSLRIFDDLDPVETQTILTVAQRVENLAVADVDADGQQEAVFHSQDVLYVYDLVSGALDYQRAGVAGHDLAIGNVDADADLEIVTTRHDGGEVLSGPNGLTEWTWPGGFGNHVATGDLDGDGLDEIAFGDSWNVVGVIDGDSQTLAWSTQVAQDVAALVLRDVEQDGDLELIYGDGQWGSLHVHDGGSGHFEWQRNNPEHGVTHIEVADVDQDGTLELLWGAGASSTGPDFLFVTEAVTGTLEWQNLHLDGPFYGLDFGDVDADGQTELLLASASTDSGYGDGIYRLHDGASKNLEFQSPEPTGLDFTGGRRLGHAQIDGDPQAEIFFTTGTAYDGLLIAYDGITHLEEWRTDEVDLQTFQSLEVIDVDGDGALEVVAGTGSSLGGSSPTQVYVYDAATGNLEWQSPALSSGTHSLLRIADVDLDPALEIVAASAGGGYRIFDGASGILETSTVDLDLTALETGDRDSDGVAEIYLGFSDGTVAEVTTTTGQTVQTLHVAGGEVRALRLVDLDQDGSADFVLAAGEDLRVLDGATGSLVWTAPGLAPSLGAADSLLVGDTDDDGRLEIAVNLNGGVRIYDAGYTIETPPQISLVAPADGSVFMEGQVVSFAATADDVQDGDLTPSVLWFSDLDSTLGVGGNLDISNLSLGLHQITASVTDSSSQTASVVFSLEILSPLAVGLAGHWTLDEASGTVAGDSSGNGYDGTHVGAPTWEGGLLGGGLGFDGVADGLAFGSTPRLDQPGTVTLAAWVRHAPSNLFRSIFDKRDSGLDGYDLYLTDASKAFLRINDEVLTGNASIADGTWHHVVGVYDGSQLVLYVDGVQDASKTVGNLVLDTVASLRIGHHFSSNDFRFAGTLDDARLYDRALDAAEVDALYRHQGSPDTRAPGRSNGSPGGVLPAGSGQALLSLDTLEPATCRYDTVPGTAYGLMPGTFTNSGGTMSHHHAVAVVDGTAYDFYVRCQDGVGISNDDDFPISFSVAAAADITTGLIGYWALDELTGTLVSDSSGNGYDGVTLGSPEWDPGQVAGGLTFDGVDDGVTVAAAPLLDSPSVLTLAAWVQHGASGTFRSILDKRDQATDGYDLYLTDTSRAFLRVNQHTLAGNTVVADGAWHHVVGIFDGTSLHLYVDGVLDASKTIGATTLDTTAPLRLGEHFSSNNFRLAGTLDEVRIYDRALDAAAVQSLASQGDP